MTPRSLTGRVVLTTVVVALVAVLAVAVVGFGLVRQESIAQTRLVLRTSAQAVAVTPEDGRAAFAARIERRSHDRIDIAFGGTGTVTGLDSSLPSDLEARLASDQRVAARTVAGSRTLLVQAVPARGGGSVIALEDVSVLHGDQVVWRFGVAAAIGVGVAVGLGIALARFITRPLRGIAATANRLRARTRTPGQDLQDPAGGEVVEVGEIRHALDALDAALERSEGRQREFLLSISHEFRTPLAAIRGYADALSDGLVPAGDLARVGGVLAGETARLDAFVQDLLALARLEAEDFPVRPVPVSVQGVLAEVVQAWAGRAATIDATVTSGPSDEVVHTDPLRLRQVLDGLVENALRVSPEGGSVRLQAAGVPAAEAVDIIVTDDGPGLSGDDLERVFVRGALRDRYQGERAVGTGLGLSIAARLVVRLGGTIRASSTGRGTTFVVRLPGAAPASQDVQPLR
jgi:two-component system sensor histidine kinase BaeS